MKNSHVEGRISQKAVVEPLQGFVRARPNSDLRVLLGDRLVRDTDQTRRSRYPAAEERSDERTRERSLRAVRLSTGFGTGASWVLRAQACAVAAAGPAKRRCGHPPERRVGDATRWLSDTASDSRRKAQPFVFVIMWLMTWLCSRCGLNMMISAS